MRKWILNPEHEHLLKLRVGDEVFGYWCEEWHAATIHKIEGSRVVVLWDSEFSSSELPPSSVKLRNGRAWQATAASGYLQNSTVYTDMPLLADENAQREKEDRYESPSQVSTQTSEPPSGAATPTLQCMVEPEVDG